MLVPGIRYYLSTRIGAETRGIATSYGASPIKEWFGELDQVPVWPHLDGTSRGPAVEPIYATAPDAARQDDALYRLLAAIDALRIGRAREVMAAREYLGEFFEGVR